MQTPAAALLVSTGTRIAAFPKSIPIDPQQDWIHPAQYAGYFVLPAATPNSIDAADKHCNLKRLLRGRSSKLTSGCVRL